MPPTPNAAEPQKPGRRWFRLSPDRFVIGLLLGVCLLWLSDRPQWFGFNHHKGWTVLIAVAAVGVAAVGMLLWWVVSLFFRWRFQFGIRLMLVFCLASSIAAGWLAADMNRARRQAEVAAWIRIRGSGTGYPPYYDWDESVDTQDTAGTAWLRRLLGVDFFCRLTCVNCTHEHSLTDAELDVLESTDDVVLLNLAETAITDAGLDHIAGMRRLKYLILNLTKIGDPGIAKLSRLSTLERLSLDYSLITDAGIDHLNRLSRLTLIYLKGTNVGDAGIAKLVQLTGLEDLRLGHTKITNAAVEQLVRLRQLHHLNLDAANVDDIGVARLAGLTELTSLSLEDTRVTDAGLEHLSGLTKLEFLNVGGTQVSDAGVHKLQVMLPNCAIIHIVR